MEFTLYCHVKIVDPKSKHAGKVGRVEGVVEGRDSLVVRFMDGTLLLWSKSQVELTTDDLTEVL